MVYVDMHIIRIFLLLCSNRFIMSFFIERLYAKPILTVAAVNQTKVVGSTAVFSCEFLTDLHPYIYWMYFNKNEYIYNETTTDPSAKESIVYQDLTKIVTVRVVSLTD